MFEATPFFGLMGLIVTGLITLNGCNSCHVNGQAAINLREEKVHNLVVETFVSGLLVPWSLAWAKDGRLFFTERPGRIRVVSNGNLDETPVAVLGDVYSDSEAGLMGMALHPDFLTNQLIYVCYARAKQTVEIEVKRMRLLHNGITDERVILAGIPGAGVHVGCRLLFGPDKKLYITTGDGAKRNSAQNLDSLAGKTLRINDDGSIPTDNPFVSTKGARPEIFSYGHRNAQGLAFQPGTGLMFQTEHGPSGFDGPGGGDEVNIVVAGKNYGWPKIHHQQTGDNLTSPLLEYTPAIAPAGAMFYSGKLNLDWKNNFLFACLRGESLVRVVVEERRVISQEKILENQFGRIRDVVEGPDGAVYFATSNRDGRGNPTKGDDRIMRITWKTKNHL